MLFDSFRKEISKYHKIGVVSHMRPDADAVGSQVAMSVWLRKNGIDVYACNDDDIPSYLVFLQVQSPVLKTNKKFLDACDAYLLLDGNDFSRFGQAGEIIQNSGKPVFMIDHHPDAPQTFNEMISVTETSSTCELVYQLFREHGPSQLDDVSGTALYAGIMTDTGSFRFDSVTADTHLYISEIIKLSGIEPYRIHQQIYEGKPMNQIILLGRVLNSIELHYNNRIATLCVTNETLKELNCTYEDLEGMVNYGTTIDGVRASVLFVEKNENYKLSLRSNSYIDVNQWARMFGGGGHVKAAGAWHSGPLRKAIEEVTAAGARQLIKDDE